MKVKGAVVEPAGLVLSGKNLRIFADNGASVSRSSAGAVVELATATTLEIYDLAIVDGLGANGTGVLLNSSGSNNQLTLNHVAVRGCGGAGVKSDGGTVTLTGATITGNKGGGVAAANGKFTLRNNVIAENGDAAAGGSAFGGVSLTSTSNDNVFEQNTVVFNHSLIGNPGASCSAIAAFHGRRNIITSNNLGLTFPASQSVGCADIESYTAAGTSSNDLHFAAIAPAPINFHLTAASPATVRDVAGLTTCSGRDIDGDPRPLNTLCDIGADEFKP
ncbi:MAG TPA: right-handed parallel beta-helix repeat-containing protein [Kofleriaceae bacterium]|nr:right-handed parallel beta-helix repeat-containing protein [Kofleriaceae bacterium]